MAMTLKSCAVSKVNSILSPALNVEISSSSMTSKSIVAGPLPHFSMASRLILITRASKSMALITPFTVACVSGTATSALAFSGYNSGLSPAYPLDTEEWNGTSWTEKSNFSSARSAGGSFGTAEAAFLIGGSPPSGGALTTVEEWTAPVNTTVTFTAS